MISPTDSMDFFKYLFARHVTEPGSLLTEPGSLIKFSHFSSHPGTCMLWNMTDSRIISYHGNIGKVFIFFINNLVFDMILFSTKCIDVWFSTYPRLQSQILAGNLTPFQKRKLNYERISGPLLIYWLLNSWSPTLWGRQMHSNVNHNQITALSLSLTQ